MKLAKGVRVVGAATCADCEKEFEVDTGEEPFAPYADFVARAIAGEVEIYCADCARRRTEIAEAEYEAYERAERQKRMARMARIPGVYQVTFDVIDRKSPAVVEAARDWAEGNRLGLALVGPWGVGKSLLAGAAASLRTWYGPVRWVSTAALLAGLRAGYGTKEQEEAARALTPVRNLALVLDDFDKARPSEAAVETLYLAVERWTSEGLPLLLTMNRGLEEIERAWPESFAEAIASRLNGYCAVVEIDGPDRRAER